MLWLLTSYWTTIGRKFLMALSGFLLGLFLLVHLVGNSFMFWGQTAFNAYADRLHSLGPLLWVFNAGLALLFAVHIVTSVFLFFENRRARPQRYAASPPVPVANWATRTMPYTGLIIFIFLVVHLMNFKLGTGPATESELVRGVLTRAGYAAFYLAGLLALTLHITHGFWSLFQTLGVSHPRYDRFIRTGALTVAIVAGTIFVLIPVLFLVNRNFLV